MKTQYLALFGLIALVLSACSSSIYEREEFKSYSNGARQAGRDLGKGRFIRLDRSPNQTSGGFAVPTSELPPNYKPKNFEGILKRRYGVIQKYNDKADFYYMQGYNAIMTAALREKYGEDYYEKAQKEAFPGVKTFYRIR